MNPTEKPALPHPVAHIAVGDDTEDVFTTDQLEAYAAPLLARIEELEMALQTTMKYSGWMDESDYEIARSALSTKEVS